MKMFTVYSRETKTTIMLEKQLEGCLFTELGFQGGFSSWIFELGFSSWIFGLDFRVGQCKLQTTGQG